MFLCAYLCVFCVFTGNPLGEGRICYLDWDIISITFLYEILRVGIAISVTEGRDSFVPMRETVGKGGVGVKLYGNN